MDPLALPKETTLRVALVVVVVVAATLAVAESLWYGLNVDHANEVLRACAEATDVLRCQRNSEQDRVLWTVAWVPVVLVAAATGAAAGSWWRRRRLVDYPGLVIPAVAEVVAGVERATGQALPLMWRPARPVASARADGIVSPYVEVGPSFAGNALTRPAASAAVLRHEWAHHQARDVAPSRFAWWSVVALAIVVVPFVVDAWDTGARRAVEGLIRLLAVVLLAVLARAAVLRAREFDADLAARRASPAGVRAALHGSGPSRSDVAVAAPLADHPSAAERVAVVDDTRRVCRLRYWDGLLVGLTTAVAAPVITRLVRGWFQFGDPAFYAEMIGWAVTGGLIGAWLAAMMIRAVAACRNEGSELRLAGFGLTAAAALVIGGYVLGTPLLLPLRSLPHSVTGVGAAVLLALGLVALAVWLRGTVGWWMDATWARRSRWAAVLVPTVVGALLGALVLGVLKHVEGLAATLDDVGDAPGGTLDPSEPFTLVSILLTTAELWVVPVLAVVAAAVPLGLVAVARRVRTPMPGWLRSTVPEDSELTRWDETPVRWWRAIVVGVAAGAFGAACYALYVAIWDPTGAVADRGWWPAGQVAFAGQSIVGVVAGVGAAAIALLVARSRATLAGLAGAVAALVGGVGAWIVRSVDAGSVHADLLDDLIVDVAVIAVIVAIVVGALMALLPRAPVTRPGRLTASLLAPIVAAAALVGAGVSAIDAEPSLARDVEHYGQVLQAVGATQLNAALTWCVQGTLTQEQATQLEAVRQALGQPAFTPSTSEVRAAHLSLERALDACLVGDVAGFQSQITSFAQQARALGLIT